MRSNIKGFTLMELMIGIAIGCIIALVLASPWVAAYLWNWVMPDLFGLKKLTTLEALKLFLVIAPFLLGAGAISAGVVSVVSMAPLLWGRLSLRVREIKFKRRMKREAEKQKEFTSWHNRTN